MRTTQKGMSLAEVLVGLAILSIMILTTITATTTALKLTKNNVNKEFATQKAISMLEELRSLVQTASGSTLTFLDAYDDGTKNQFVLTTQSQLVKKPEDATKPGDLISGNVPRGDGWLYERRISVQPVPGQGNDVRFVNVKVFINEDGGQRLLAEVASVLRTLVVDMPPTQVYDVYAVAVENVPGWWVYMSNIVPFVRTTIADLQARNPGLVFRTHWIHTLAYGRDWQYRPYTNDANPSTNDIDWAYFYPGKMPATSTAVQVGDDYYYPWFLFRAVMNRDGSTENGYLDDEKSEKHNPWPYAIADNFNNAMRYPDELAHYEKRRDAALKVGKTEELTWRLLIEQMYSNPSDFTNAIVINLHGELLPFPPVRNYSDAAKSPQTHPNIRAVTHPEQLRYTNDEDVKLRVYTYRMDPDNNTAGTNYFGDGGFNDVPVTIRILGTKNWNPEGDDVQIIRGGTNQDGDTNPDPYDAVPVNAPTGANGQAMYYKKPTAPAGEVVLELYKSPLKHRQDGNGGGLAPAARLYGLEYIPAPMEDLTQTAPADQFKRHLGDTCCPRVYAMRDTFSGTSDYYGQDNGTVKFASDWVEQADNNTSTSGRVRVDSNKLRLSDNYSSGDDEADQSKAYREADLYKYDRARVSFNWNTSGVETDDKVIFEVSKNGGTTYAELETFTSLDGTKEGFETYDVTGYISNDDDDTTVFRFRTVNYTSTDFFYVDNFQVEASYLSDLPKNTARWIITIPKEFIEDNSKQPLTIETRIGETVTEGVMYPTASVPPNLSRTYVWVGDDDHIFGGGGKEPALPITEQFQFMGDPRHLPYADLKRPHIGSGFGATYENRLGMGYNRYHDDFETSTSGNLTTVSIIARDKENYTFGGNSNLFAALVNGTTNVTVELPKGTAQSASNVAATLNANANFKAVAFADTTSSRLRLTSKLKGGSIQYDNEHGNNGAIFGFEGSTIWDSTTGTPWPGWTYKDGDGVQFGVKNDGTADNDTWHSIELDVPRAFQMLRSGLIQSSALWTTMTGYSYYYMGVGNEIGYDEANNFRNSIPVSTKPYSGSGGSRTEQTIIDLGIKYIRQQSTETGWWSIYWLGELYPDSQYAAESNWKSNGNLRAGAGASYYVRDLRDKMPGFTGTKLVRSERRTGPRGSTTLFWGEAKTSAFHHSGTDGDSKILDDGKDIRDNYALPVPDEISTNRPWAINVNSSDVPENFLTKSYAPPRRLQLMQRYFERKGNATYTEGSSLVAMTDPINGKPAFIIVNGLSPTGITGTTFIAKWSFLTLIQSFLNGGMFSDTEAYDDPDGAGGLDKPVPGNMFHIRQLPRVSITDPNQDTPLKNPSSVKIAWEEKWTRWDGARYSRAYPSGCQDKPEGCYDPEDDYTRQFIVLYSPSNGAPDLANDNPTGWFYTDGSVGYLGTRDLENHGIDELEFTLPTPVSTFPEGNYLFRVEEYRTQYPQHYSFHQYRAYIQRQ